MKDIYVFGDSHWRIFFPFVNHGSPGVAVELNCGIRINDMVANELSGATMYGLLNENSKNGARKRILNDLDKLGPVEYVALVFGEVDVRYHNHHYFNDSAFIFGNGIDLLLRYIKFIKEDLLLSGRVTKKVIIFNKFFYPQKEKTLLQPGIEIGKVALDRAIILQKFIENNISMVISACDSASCDLKDKVALIDCKNINESHVSNDGVHFDPEKTFLHILPELMSIVYDKNKSR